MKRGFVRLWVLASILWLAICALLLGWRISAEPPCYSLFTASFVEPIPENNRAIVLVGKPICGNATPPLLWTLQSLAKEGVATQISFQWRETAGWSADTSSFIDILQHVPTGVNRDSQRTPKERV